MNNILKQTVEHRRWFHRHPEIGFNVFKTQNYIIDQLKKLKIFRIEKLARTGIKAVYIKEKELKCIAFRADMDALSIQERNEVAYKSKYDGYMHACGHDGHMAMLLGFAQWVSENTKQLTCNIVLIFQPAEESVGGALPMIKEGALDNPVVNEIYGIHIFPEISEGVIGIRSGAFMSQASEFDIVLEGKSAHGAKPHMGKDALLAACELVTSLQKIISREIPSDETAVLTIGKLTAGDRRNIVAEKAVLEGTLRTYSERLYETIKGRIIQTIKGIELTTGVKVIYEEKVVYPVVVNDAQLVKNAKKTLANFKIVELEKQMIAEDFSYYQKYTKGLFLFLGSKGSENSYSNPLHSNNFDFNEKILMVGINVYKNLAMKDWK